MQDVFIAGYSDKLSARPGETVTFFVSSHAREAFKATLHRSISADPNPDGPGIIEDDASTYFNPSWFASRYQGFTPGSFAQSTIDLQADIKSDLVIKLWFMPKVLVAADQTLLAWGIFLLIFGSIILVVNIISVVSSLRLYTGATKSKLYKEVEVL